MFDTRKHEWLVEKIGDMLGCQTTKISFGSIYLNLCSNS